MSFSQICLLQSSLIALFPLLLFQRYEIIERKDMTGCDDLFSLSNVPDSSKKAHRVLLLVTFLYMFINIMMPELKYVAFGLSIGLFVYYTWQRVLMIIIMAVVAFGLVSVFPFLAPVAFILMVLIFLARISYILHNWRAVLAGFYMYFLAFGFAMAGQFVGPAVLPYFEWLFYLLYHITPSLLPIAGLAIYGVIAFFGTWTFHQVILWLYRNHYSLKEALPIMGVAPLLIALLFLPFLKTVDVVDTAFGDAHDVVGDSAPDTFHSDAVETHDFADPVHSDVVHGDAIHGEAVHGEAIRAGDGIHSPGTHYTHGYLRTGVNGDVHYVRGYEATNPDGILENNYSAHGISNVRGEPIPYEPAPAPAPAHVDGNLSKDIPFIGGTKEEIKPSKKRVESPAQRVGKRQS